MATPSLSQRDKNAAKLSHELTTFADSLKPSKTYIDEGKRLVQAVFTGLQRERQFSISRSFFGGSVGKNTSVIFPDYDCVVFLNNKQPPMKGTVEEFVSFLKREASQLTIIPESIKHSSITAQIRFQNGAELDLLPAISFNQESPEQQCEEVLKKIKETKNIQDYSSSLAETVIQFLKDQPGVTHQLIRLTKYWYKSLSLDSYLYGGSTLIEIISVVAVYETESNSFYIIRALQNFFKKVQTIDKLKIAFFRENGEWRLVPEREMQQNKYKTYFAPEILKRPNFIIEPANPFNDMAKNLKPNVIDKLKHFAKIMTERLDELEKSERNVYKSINGDRITLHFEKLFEPFPLRLRGTYSHAGIPVYLLIHYDYQNHETAHCKTDENNKEFFKKNAEAHRVTNTIRKNLLFLIRSKAKRDNERVNFLQFTDGLAEMSSKNGVKEAMKIIIDQNFGVSQFIKESPSNKEHQSYDATVYVPYRLNGRTFAVRLSLKWEH